MDTTVEPILREKCSKDLIRPAIVQSSKENAEEETNVKLLTDHKEFVDSLRRTKQPWKVPWFIVIMCSLQVCAYICRYVRVYVCIFIIN